MTELQLRRLAVVALSLVLVLAVIGTTLVALFTRRQLSRAVGLEAGLAVVIAALAGLHLRPRSLETDANARPGTEVRAPDQGGRDG